MSSFLSPTRDLYAYAAHSDKKSSQFELSPTNYSSQVLPKTAASTAYDKRTNSNSKSTFNSSHYRKDFIAEALIRKTIENLDTKVEKQVKTLRKSQYSQLSNKNEFSYNTKQKRGGSTAFEGHRSKLRVNYSHSLQQITKNLYIYDQLLENKRAEKETLQIQIKNLKLDLKHTNEEKKMTNASESDLLRETHKIEKIFKRKNEESFFFEKEITEIKSQIPELQESIQEYRELINELQKRIEDEVKVREEESELIPKLLTSLSEIQMQKDRLSTEIVKQQKMKERLNEEIVRIMCESNSLYVRTEKNICNPNIKIPPQ